MLQQNYESLSEETLTWDTPRARRALSVALILVVATVVVIGTASQKEKASAVNLKESFGATFTTSAQTMSVVDQVKKCQLGYAILMADSSNTVVVERTGGTAAKCVVASSLDFSSLISSKSCAYIYVSVDVFCQVMVVYTPSGASFGKRMTYPSYSDTLKSKLNPTVKLTVESASDLTVQNLKKYCPR